MSRRHEAAGVAEPRPRCEPVQPEELRPRRGSGGEAPSLVRPPATARTPTGRRRWLFRAVLVLVPLPLPALAGARSSVRVGYGVPMDFALRQEVEGEPRVLSNPRFTWLFFEPGVARIASPFSLRRHEAAGHVPRLRPGQLGGPGRPGAGLRHRPRARGAAARPVPRRRRSRSSSAAATAVNSHFVYAAARAVPAARARPSRRLRRQQRGRRSLRRGHGAHRRRAAPAARPRGGRRPGARASGSCVARRRARRGKGLGRGDAPGAWHGMEMFLEQQVRRGDPALERGLPQLRGATSPTPAASRARPACRSS